MKREEYSPPDQTEAISVVKQLDEGYHTAVKASREVEVCKVEPTQQAKPVPVAAAVEAVPEICPFENEEPPVPEFPEPKMNVPSVDWKTLPTREERWEHFKQEARKDVAPTRAEKDLMKLRKKL